MRRNLEEFNFWPSVADMFLSVFLVMLVLWFVTKVQLTASKGTAIDAPGLATDNRRLREENDRLKKELEQARGEFARLTRQSSDKPPVIRIAENDNYRFPSGSAELTSKFVKRLENEIFLQVIEALRQYPKRIDTIEIVGHTDSEPVSRDVSTLDAFMISVLNGALPPDLLRAGSNTDLGMMRALAIRKLLRPWLDDRGHQMIQIRCYSAGPGVDADGTVPTLSAPVKDENRRRIEILFMGLRNAGRDPEPPAP